MRYCQECGKKIKKYAEVCMNCGASNEVDMTENLKEKLNDTIAKTKEYSEKAVEKGQEIKNSQEFKKTTKNVSNKTKKIIDGLDIKIKELIYKLKNINKKFLGIIVTLILIVILGLCVAIKPQSPESVVDKFEDAIIAEDLEKLKSVVRSEDKRLEVTSKNLKGITAYYKANPSNLNKDIDYLKNYSLEEQYAEAPFKLIKEKKVLKEKYYISLSPRYIEFESNYKNIKVDLSNGKDIIQENLKSGEIGPFMPGQYKLVVNSTSEFSDFKQTQDIDLFYGEMLRYVNIDIEINQNEIVSNYPEAIVYINGKNTEKTAKELGVITGLKNGTKIYGIMEIDGKKIKSMEQKVDYNSDIQLEFDYTKPPTVEEAKIGISDMIGAYLIDFSNAVNNSDPSNIEEYVENDSSIHNEHKKNIPGMYERGIREEYIDHEIIDITYDEDSRTGSLSIKEKYKIMKDDSVEEKTFNTKYTFKYDDENKVYKLTSIVN